MVRARTFSQWFRGVWKNVVDGNFLMNFKDLKLYKNSIKNFIICLIDPMQGKFLLNLILNLKTFPLIFSKISSLIHHKDKKLSRQCSLHFSISIRSWRKAQLLKTPKSLPYMVTYFFWAVRVWVNVAWRWLWLW